MTRNEILAENILLEKSQLEEAENINHIRQLEEERTELQKELGYYTTTATTTTITTIS